MRSDGRCDTLLYAEYNKTLCYIPQRIEISKDNNHATLHVTLDHNVKQKYFLTTLAVYRMALLCLNLSQ